MRRPQITQMVQIISVSINRKQPISQIATAAKESMKSITLRVMHRQCAAKICEICDICRRPTSARSKSVVEKNYRNLNNI